MSSKGIAEGFTRDELDRFESMLLERRHLLLNDLQTQEELEAGDSSEQSTAATHLADLGSDRASSDVSLGRRESETSEIREIDEALERLRDGSFGRCENCERPMSKDRLEAIPYARLCIPCKTEEEREGTSGA
ncbi:MAG: TraR/DksA C4-type zinc finger protein [Planctomycetes bacterium]|nr:TraR/DksA C4-type zinc finger protein [Planctomycetota bacterium]